MSCVGMLAWGAAHPLDPLSAAEIGSAVRLAKAAPGFPEGALFPLVALHEPQKAAVAAGAAPPRIAFVVALGKDGKTFEALADLTAGRLIHSGPGAGGQPPVLAEEFKRVPEIVRADPRWRRAMERRGYENFDAILIDPWASGPLRHPGIKPGQRVLRALSYVKGTSSNIYARPIEGVAALVNMSEGRVVDFTDGGIIPVSREDGAIDAAATGPRRTVKPLRIHQPEGVGFEVKGQEIRWQNWSFRVSLHPREGPILHQVTYWDKGQPRSVLYRASLSEMAVPYGDPDAGWQWRSAFDVGEYGIGRLSSPQDVGRDAPENAVLLDAVFADDFGVPYVSSRALSVYERDGGVLWKHFDSTSGINESRRARELVVANFAAVSNYDYGLKWIFRQDGSLEFEADLTGIMLAKGVPALPIDGGAGTLGHDASGSGESHAHGVAPNVVAPHHQHFFCFRLDLDVDGPANRLIEVDVRSLEAERNPAGNGIVMEERVLKDERQARRSLDLSKHRRWKIASAKNRNSLGQATSFLLSPGENSLAYALPGSSIRRRAGFLDHHVWGTRERGSELYASGYYPNQNDGGEGLPLWSGTESLDGEDLVVWYVLGVTHVPRPEEWPVMPTTNVGFKLLPAGFFARNPALDAP